MFTQDITQTLVASGIGAWICTMIYFVGYETGKSAQASMVRGELGNIFVLALDMKNGLQTLREELDLLKAEGK